MALRDDARFFDAICSALDDAELDALQLAISRRQAALRDAGFAAPPAGIVRYEVDKVETSTEKSAARAAEQEQRRLAEQEHIS